MNAHRLGLIALAAAITACAGTPGPGDAGYPYNVEGAYTGSITVNGVPFAGNLTVEIGEGGVVRGTFNVTQPAALEVRLTGTVVGNELTAEMSYDGNPATGCTTTDSGDVTSDSTATGTLIIADGGAELSGPVTVQECGQTLPASAQFTR